MSREGVSVIARVGLKRYGESVMISDNSAPIQAPALPSLSQKIIPEQSVMDMGEDDLLSALQIQYDWGVEAVMDDMPWDVLGHEKAGAQGAGQARISSPVPRAVASPADSRPVVSSPSSTSLARIMAAQTVAELVEQSRKIEGVTLGRTATHHLAPVLVKNAQLLLIGEIPDEEEDRTGILFSGPSGRILDRILSSIGLKREQISMAPAIPWRPPGGQPVSAHELAQCMPILHRTIALAAPRYILAMGSMPTALLLGRTSRFSQSRGKWHDIIVPGCEMRFPLLPVMHPGQLVGTSRVVPTHRRTLWYDMLGLAEKLGL